MKDNLTADELIELTELEYGEYYSFWTFYNIESDIEQVEFHTYPTGRYSEYIQDLHIAKNALDFSDEIDSINSSLEDINLEDIKYSLEKLKICPEYKETKQRMQDIQDLVDDFKEQLENKIEDLCEYSDKK
ncbi:hypothetical protein [Metamycoplasma equirhinis]|uniref:hypothetical protein n=1 Tax=Metamycoplasma equirhinis TaxID=92402 RepID=UPI003593F384